MTTSQPLKVALAGCGAVTQLYYATALQDLERLGQIRVAALFDPNPINAKHIHSIFPAAVPVQDFDTLTRYGIDLAIIASPPQYHAAQTIQCLQSGISVLCEKPMALSASEGEAMVAAAAKAQCLLAIGLVRRFFPAAQTIRTLLSSNTLGSVKSFSCTEGRVFKWPVQSASYFRENGVLRDIGVHALDLLLWWWGEPEEIVYEDDAMGGVELNCRMQLKFPQSFTGEVRLSREFRFPNSCVIQCENGNIHWDIDETNQLQIRLRDSKYYMASQLHTMNSSMVQDLMVHGPVAADFLQCFDNQLQNVIAAVRGTESLLVPGEAGLASLKAIDNCYSQRVLMDMPWLSAEEVVRAREVKDMQRR
jgi:predicted dehydrogenase